MGFFLLLSHYYSIKKLSLNILKSVAIRGLLSKNNLNNIDQNNVSLFLGPNLHFVIYPLNKVDDFNFIGILKKRLNKDDLNNQALFKDKNFLSSILTKLSDKIDKKITDNLKEIKCFPIFMSNQIYEPKQKKNFSFRRCSLRIPTYICTGRFSLNRVSL